MSFIEVEDGVKLQQVELRVYYADGTFRVVDFSHPNTALSLLKRDFEEHVIFDFRIVPVYTKGEKR